MDKKWLLLTLLLSGCNYFRDSSDTVSNRIDPEQLRTALAPLELHQPFVPSPAEQRYFEFYTLNPAHCAHWFGFVQTKQTKLATHFFRPSNARGTLFLVHGYFDHTGTLSKLIQAAIAQHYAIVAFDLPGHGLSTGERTVTGSLASCATDLTALIEHFQNFAPSPFHLIAHSTGCSIALDLLYQDPAPPLDKIVFMAPLIHNEHWGWSKFGYYIARPFTSRLRRRAKQNSSDPEYLAFVKKDPLHSPDFSFQFLSDLYAWNNRMANAPVWPGRLLIIQGDQDKVIDWDFNLAFLKEKIQSPTITMISGARHQLANERDDLRTQTFHTLFEYLSPSNARPLPATPLSAAR